MHAVTRSAAYGRVRPTKLKIYCLELRAGVDELGIAFGSNACQLGPSCGVQRENVAANQPAGAAQVRR